MVDVATRPARYRMVEVRPCWLMVEREVGGPGVRAWLSTEAAPPMEEYREAGRLWKATAQGQTFTFTLEDAGTGERHAYGDLLGLAFFASAPAGSPLRRIGEAALAERVSVYVAVSETPLDEGRLAALNRFFNQRLADPGKKIVILPDLFGLFREFSEGQILADFGLTSMEEP